MFGGQVTEYLWASEFSSVTRRSWCLTTPTVGKRKAPATVPGTAVISHGPITPLSRQLWERYPKPKHKAMQKLPPGHPRPPFSLGSWTAGSQPEVPWGWPRRLVTAPSVKCQREAFCPQLTAWPWTSPLPPPLCLMSSPVQWAQTEPVSARR